jgi:hypothetical protein
VPTTIDRVPHATDEEINRRIQRQTRARVRACAIEPRQIDERLRELDAEWDIERVLETNASIAAFAGVALGVTVNRRWLALPALVTAFLFQHAVQGWCPPLPLLRRAGFRTSREIDLERVALKVLRGDFRDRLPAEPRSDSQWAGSWKRADHALQAAELS